jgi:hypothetical protein
MPRQVDSLVYECVLPAVVVGDREWVTLGLETVVKVQVTGDGRDLRVVLDWLEVAADAEPRELWEELSELLPPDLARGLPGVWRMKVDPNNVGSTYTPHRFDTVAFDDSAWPRVPTGVTPVLARGEAVWYRAAFLLTRNAAEQKPLILPGAPSACDGRREVWVNNQHMVQDTEDDDASFARRVQEVLVPGLNTLFVKTMAGPVPRVRGSALVEAPEFRAVRADASSLTLHLENVTLAPGNPSTSLTLTLLDREGGTVAPPLTVDVTETGDDTPRTAAVQTDWTLTEMGEYTFEVRAPEGLMQSLPIHFLGIHFFHWGWYSAGEGTAWKGFTPCSNDYIDQLLGRLAEADTPHHSISWGGAVISPGTGFHLTDGADYIGRFREAFAEGTLELVGMPYQPRNVCTDFGESLVRSIRRSRRLYAEQFGQTPTRFYSHDATMTPRLPQLMQLCGYDTYCISENWWGQGFAIPNSRDCFFHDSDGTAVRVLDSWYHGLSPVAAARRAVVLGKPAVLCNEEFACLDHTLFLEPEHLDALAVERIFLTPVTLDQYQGITHDYATRTRYQGDRQLCYKGWTGGGEHEMEFEKVNRLLGNRLVAVDTTTAMAQALGLDAASNPMDLEWDFSLRAHECHLHWGNGYPHLTQGLRKAFERAENLLQDLASGIAGRVAEADAKVLALNPLGWPQGGLLELPIAPKGSLVGPGGRQFPLQPHPRGEGYALAAVPTLPACGYQTFAIADSEASQDTPLGVETTNTGTRLTNGVLSALVADNGSLVRVTDPMTLLPLLEDGNELRIARPHDRIPEGAQVSTPRAHLNPLFFAGLRAVGKPEVVTQGPAMVSIRCRAVAEDHPGMQVYTSLGIVAGERLIRVRVDMVFTEPTVLSAPGARAPHEGTYVPGLYVRFPYSGEQPPMADMAYCVTDGVLDSTNHATFLNVPFRNATFNALSLAGPPDARFAVLTRGLPDFFVVHPEAGAVPARGPFPRWVCP